MSGLSLRELFDHHGSDKARTHGYHVAYELLCSPFRETATAVLEIGVDRGASLMAWHRWFPMATVIGVDKNPACAAYVPATCVFECGLQTDEVFLRNVGTTRGPFDLVVDDGAHWASHQLVALRTLWPFVKQGGVYAVEDVHCEECCGRSTVDYESRPFSVCVEAAHREIGRLDDKPGLMVTFYRNGIFLHKPISYDGAAP